MKSAIILFSMLLLASSAFAQDAQYVLQTKGDTLVVKDDADFSGQNTLYLLMVSDSMAPATRVYQLHNGGVYSLVNTPTSSTTKRVVIAGESNTSVKTNKSTVYPPILQGAVWQGGSSTGGLNSGYDLLVKNCMVEIGNSAGGEGWGFFGGNASSRLEVDNCIMEHNLWVTFFPVTNWRLFLNNDYFVNLSGHTCRRNGGVIDFFGNIDTIQVQNCTHVYTQGSLYKARFGYRINRYLFNHNDFIDCAGFVLMNIGDHPNYSVTNNIFVNCQLQAYCPVLSGVDVGEVDQDSLPMGLVNIKVDSAFIADGRSFYADKNLAYWDASLADIPSTLNSGTGVDGNKHWVSQMITMNTRTAAIFADKANNPKCTNGTWFNKLPTFAKTDVLFGTGLATLKTYAISAVDTGFTGSLAAWRQSSNPMTQYYCYADWPLPIDLSYTDTDLLTAGLNGFPLGDLNWFPTQYASWKAQEATELAQIQQVLAVGTGVTTKQGPPQKFELLQNYPNPFNPTTRISYTIARAANVTLKVYNMLGQEVATLVDGFQAANTYEVNFNASHLASGVYIYELRSGSNVASGKMVLMK